MSALVSRRTRLAGVRASTKVETPQFAWRCLRCHTHSDAYPTHSVGTAAATVATEEAAIVLSQDFKGKTSGTRHGISFFGWDWRLFVIFCCRILCGQTLEAQGG